jgi:hypothetical protein
MKTLVSGARVNNEEALHRTVDAVTTPGYFNGCGSP